LLRHGLVPSIEARSVAADTGDGKGRLSRDSAAPPISLPLLRVGSERSTTNALEVVAVRTYCRATCKLEAGDPRALQLLKMWRD
jgi:hypothetical protein